MKSDTVWQVVFETNNQIEATLVQDYLESNGIIVVLKPDESLIYAGGMLHLANYQLWVPESQLEQAKQLIQEKETQKL